MHKIERLLQTLAPKGVGFKTLEEVFEIKNGYTPSKNNPEFWKNGTIPWFRMEDLRENGRILKDSIQHITPKALKGKKLFPKNSIIISTTATIGEHALLIVDSLANQRFTFLSKKANCNLALDMKFFFYQCFLLGEWCKNNTNVSGFASVDMTAFKKYKFPIPPLEIQQEIVTILDAFTELNAELNARKKQYKYYQNMLLDFNDINQNRKDAKERLAQKPYPKRLKQLLQTLAPKGVEFRKLGDIGEFYGGLVGKSKKSFSQGNKFYVPYVNVFNNPQLDLNALESVQIGDKEKQNTIQLGDVLFTGSSENLEDCAMSCVVTQKIEKDIYLNSFCFGFRFFDKNLFNPSFLKHFLRDYNFRKNISKVANGVTRFNVSKQLLSQITIPIPPLEIQQEIVKILDQFSLLTTDLLAGIPAEIKARKKQYEYYREKLLTFKPLTPHKEVKK
ncbi:restriction endonuclease subunit S [Helicobacter pylori]|uniref:Type I restriction enzyme, S subunit n=1 Tax=Helicobacter pylori Hp P-15 TaxID=992080 RepID=J0QAJ4_HELPX|nr:restriction endonuclease subunit S [Helicobacter pylori]EJC07796.1 type I restriction enzyme, S subunit [Helicobacter pylori Hp P-15]EJC32562.1 type I restriction modification DNA specificity domain protein [Helicobacter pylori Hp P-15b]